MFAVSKYCELMHPELEYPRDYLDKAMEMAAVLHRYGGRLSRKELAVRMGRQTSGAFAYLVSAAVKYDLIKIGRAHV